MFVGQVLTTSLSVNFVATSPAGRGKIRLSLRESSANAVRGIFRAENFANKISMFVGQGFPELHEVKFGGSRRRGVLPPALFIEQTAHKISILVGERLAALECLRTERERKKRRYKYKKGRKKHKNAIKCVFVG